MKSNRSSRVFAGIALLAISSAGFGQAPEADRLAAPEEEIEEIVVYGEKSLLVLKLDIKRASDVVFESFNVLNDDDEFDIHCSNRVPTGSSISKGSCRPNFEDQIYHETMQKQIAMSGNEIAPGFRVDNVAIEAKLKKKKKILDAKMEALANENPEFAKAVIKLYIAEQIFAAEKERRCAGRIICRKTAPDLEPSLNSSD